MILPFLIIGIMLGVFAAFMFYKQIDNGTSFVKLIFLVWLPGMLSGLFLATFWILLVIKLAKIV